MDWEKHTGKSAAAAACEEPTNTAADVAAREAPPLRGGIGTATEDIALEGGGETTTRREDVWTTEANARAVGGGDKEGDAGGGEACEMRDACA